MTTRSPAKGVPMADLSIGGWRVGLDAVSASTKRLHQTPLERRQLFETISAPCSPKEFLLQLGALVELTNQGKDVSTFESELLPLVTKWLDYWFTASTVARKKEKEKGSKGRGAVAEETNLNRIYGFVNELVRFSFSDFQEPDVSSLLGQLLRICRGTTSSTDIESSINIFNALVIYGQIPRLMLEPCLDVLCGAYGTLKDLEALVWITICNLCKSHTAQNAVTALLDIVRSPSALGDRNTNTIRGAVLILNRIMISNGAEGLVTVSFATVMDAFHQSLAAGSSRLEVEVVDAIAKFFDDEVFSGVITQEDDWSSLLDVLAQCSRKLDDVTGVRSKGSKEKENSIKLSNHLAHIIEHLERFCSIDTFEQKQSVIAFFKVIHRRIPHTCTELLVKYYAEEHLCYPSDPDWVAESRWLVESFFCDPTRPASTRLLVLRLIADVHAIVADHFPSTTILDLVMPILYRLREETDVEVLEALKGFVVEIAGHSDEALFDTVLITLAECLSCGAGSTTTPSEERSSRASSIHSKPTSSRSRPPVANMSIHVLITVFLRSINSSAYRANKIFDLLLRAVQSRECDMSARMDALKLLFRLRSDSTNAVFLATMTESEALASTLGRTAESRHAKRTHQESTRHQPSKPDNTDSGRSSRSSSAGRPPSSTTNTGNRSVVVSSRFVKPASRWVYPDEYALPEAPPSDSSPLVFSHIDALHDPHAQSGSQTMMILNVKLWLEILISILQLGDDWEIYSYILVHLGSQLTNHAFFTDAVPQIQMLRNVLCEQLRVNSFHDPPPLSGAKKADVMICLLHTLALLLTYHEHFSKNEQDEIVRMFVSGVGSGERTAKYCIHALSICCHELPLSISKSLNNILQKMSQIITQSQVAIHILEFLVGLARMPDVCVNFREDDYRTVFGICFRYLQYVRDQRQKGSEVSGTRSSNPPEGQIRTKRESGPTAESVLISSTSNDLPQYVYALAYHVITFWLMSVKLVERARYISWITKNLILTDSTGKEVIDEQSQITIDMMQRITFSDHDETLPDPHFASTADGPTTKKSWLIGMSILTVETAMRSGVSQLTKRQPSATTYSTYRSRLAPRPLHQIPLTSNIATDAHEEDARVEVLPNHVLLQLTSSPWRTPESMRPIPLPDDETTRRAISLFDRNSTLDGHKVGIIYIGEGQTNEAEILANVVGNEDFSRFLTEIGTLTRLKGAQFNTQGLDREMDTDGLFTFCWRDRVTEIVFHIPAMMPSNLDRDPQCTNKKRHTGNDFVNIIFNNSGLPFRFDTFPSEFNYVNIVISPEARSPLATTSPSGQCAPEKQFYKVQVMSKPGFPELSPAAEIKVVSGKSLPAFVRLIALNASVFSLVWANRESGELISSWRNRLREIVKLRDKHAAGGQSSSAISPPGTVHGGSSAGGTGSRDANTQRESVNFRRTSGPMFFGDGIASHRSSVLSTATTATETDPGGYLDGESLADGYDFSKWAS